MELSNSKEEVWDRLKNGILSDEDKIIKFLYEEIRKEVDKEILDQLSRLAAKDDL